MIEVVGNNVKFAGIQPNSGVTSPVGGHSVASIPSQKPDEFVKQGREEKENKKLSTNAKIGIGAGILTTAGLIAATIFTKGKTLKPANFAEHIDFKPAKTMEEAAEFAKKHLGVEKFDFGNDVEMANWVNEGLVKLNNRFKGKAQMPKNIIFDEKFFAKDPNAAAYHCAKNETIAINKKYFDGVHERLNKLIDEGKIAEEKIRNNGKVSNKDLVLSALGKNVRINDAGNFVMENPIRWLDTDLQASLAVKVYKYKQNPENFSRFDVADILMQVDDLWASGDKLFNKPFSLIKRIAEKNPEFFKTHCKDLSYYEKLSKEEQIINCAHIIDNLSDATNSLCSIQGTYRSGSKFGTLWHEMGHLLHDMNTSLKDNVWGRLSNNAEKTFLADNGKLETAGKISWYAQTNQYEFVAETFNALCAGKKLPKDVMDLYKYYKGPELPNM